MIIWVITRTVSDTILLVTIISMAFVISTELICYVMHYAIARAKILASQARINPVPHPREHLPFPVPNESLYLATQPHHDACLAYQFNFSSPRVCLRVCFYLRLSLPFSVSTTNVYSRRRNLKPNGSDRDRSLPRRKTARMINCQQVGNSSVLVTELSLIQEITKSWNIMYV